jgi:hypothetical protein
MDPDRYRVEPYVTPGNADGPDSPHFGRGGWTWYTGSAAWMFRVGTEWILGVRPTYDGLLVRPCVPPDWKGFSMKRTFRGSVYRISVSVNQELDAGRASRAEERERKSRVRLDGKVWRSDVIPAFEDGREHEVEIEIPAAAQASPARGAGGTGAPPQGRAAASSGSSRKANRRGGSVPRGGGGGAGSPHGASPRPAAPRRRV